MSESDGMTLEQLWADPIRVGLSEQYLVSSLLDALVEAQALGRTTTAGALARALRREGVRAATLPGEDRVAHGRVALEAQRELVHSLRRALFHSDGAMRVPAVASLARALHREGVELDRIVHSLPAEQREALSQEELEDLAMDVRSAAHESRLLMSRSVLGAVR